jgi:rhodanese-related sulfurtransferase
MIPVDRRPIPANAVGRSFIEPENDPSVQDMDAVSFFAAKLAFQTDVSDVHAAGKDGFTLVDTRDLAAWRQGHVPGAVHLPRRMIPMKAVDLLPTGTPVVVYCWGPGCDGATKAALALAERGYKVKEMIGGIEYWIREGFPVETAGGIVTRDPDPLTAPVARSGKPAGRPPSDRVVGV